MSTVKIKEWPKDNKPADFEDITLPLVNAVHFCYDVKRQNKDKDVPYNGFDIGRHCSHAVFGVKDKLTAKNMRYSEEEQSRSALTEIISLAVQLGMEQGRRIDTERNEMKKLILEATLTNAGLPKDEIDELIGIILR